MPRKKQEDEQALLDQEVDQGENINTEEPIDEEAIKAALEIDKEDAGETELDDVEEVEEEPDLSGVEKVQRAKRLLGFAKDARRKYDREWLSRDLFRRGYQFVSNNQRSGAITMSSRNNSKIPVNLVWAFARSIVNQITTFNPKFEVLPEYKGKKAESDARLAGKALDSIFKVNNMTKLIKEAVIQGLFFSTGGPFEVWWDADYDNGKNQPKGEVKVRIHDPFDIYFDPNATDLEEAAFIIKAVRTDIETIKANPLYKDKVKQSLSGGTLKRAESEYKQFLLQTIQNSQQNTEDNESTILYEMHEKINDDGDVRVHVLTWIDGIEEPLRDEEVDQEYYDMEIFQADMNPLEMYGESWSKHVIALNRVINALESSIFDYHYRYAKGRLVIDKNSGIREVTNEHGSIIEKNRGATVTSLPIAPLPESYQSQIMRMNARAEDIAGVHDASLGRAPASVKSGIGIAELKQSDSSNQDDLVQNLERCLMRLGTKILKKMAANYTTPRIKKVVGTGRLVEHFAVVGSDYIGEDKTKWKIGEEKYPLAHIAYNNELSVSIGSWLAYTKEGRQKVLMDMAGAGIIDKETVLKYFEFPDIQDIVDKKRIESLVEQKRKEEPTMPMGISQEQLAMAENEMLMEETPAIVDPEQDDHELHIAIHSSILDEENGAIVQGHIAEHRRAQKGGGQALAQNMPAAPEPQMPPMPQQMPASMPQMAPQAPQVPMPMVVPEIQRPEASYFSAGVAEMPQTATSIIGGPANTVPIS